MFDYRCSIDVHRPVQTCTPCCVTPARGHRPSIGRGDIAKSLHRVRESSDFIVCVRACRCRVSLCRVRCVSWNVGFLWVGPLSQCRPCSAYPRSSLSRYCAARRSCFVFAIVLRRSCAWCCVPLVLFASCRGWCMRTLRIGGWRHTPLNTQRQCRLPEWS